MRGTLAAQAYAQNGLVTRTQALTADYTERELRTLLKPGGQWHTVRRGVYADAREWAGLQRDEQYRRTVRAVLLNTAQPVLASHSSAAAVAGAGQLHEVMGRVHVLGDRLDGTRAENGVQYHRGHLPAEQVVETPYGLATSLPRSAADVARAYGYRDGLVVADHALRVGHTREELAAVVEGMRGWPGVTRARALVAMADGGAANVGETLMRVIVTELGFGLPETQYEVCADGRVAYVDLRLGLQLFEFDGAQKYLRDLTGRGRTPSETVFEEKKREDWLRATTGMGMSRVVWDECLTPAAVERCRRRLRAEVERTIERVGMRAWMASLG